MASGDEQVCSSLQESELINREWYLNKPAPAQAWKMFCLRASHVPLENTKLEDSDSDVFKLGFVCQLRCKDSERNSDHIQTKFITEIILPILRYAAYLVKDTFFS